MKISFQFGELRVESEWNDSETAKKIAESLPVTSSVSRWGDEIYFAIPVQLPPENATRNVVVGDIAYWPEGACLCLFFGKTPISVDDHPRPASEVNLIGKFSAPPDVLRKVRSGTSVKVSA